jgi:hypothetical protein
VRIELATLYRRVDRGDLESRDGSRRAFMLRQVADIIVFAELESRIVELEAKRESTP